MARLGIVSFALILVVCGCGEATSRREGSPDAGASETPTPPPLLFLEEAAARGDGVELERVALRLREETLVGAMRDAPRRVRLAAVDAAPHVRRPWTLLEALVERFADSDRETASRAVASALRVTDVWDERAVAVAEVSAEAIARIAESATEAAADVRLAPDVRASAASVAARLQALAQTDAARLVGALDDSDPEVRHGLLAALRAWGPRLSTHRTGLERALGAEDPRTALLAVAALCAAGRLPAATARRARELLPRGSPTDRALLAPCLDTEPAEE